MKSCPACNRTFEDTFSFCLVDGSILSAPFDPGAVRNDSSTESNDPPPTEVISANAPAALEQTQPSPVSPPGPTIKANFQPAQSVSPSGTRETFATAGREHKPNLLVWMLGGIALLLVIVVAVLVLRSGSPPQTASLEPTANKAAPATSPTPDEAKVHRDRGNIFKAEKRYAEAEREYREAIRINPKDVNAHANLGQILDMTNRKAEAVTEYREALRLKPDLDPHWAAAVHYNIGKALYGQQKYDEAEAEYRESIRLDPNLGSAHMNLGLTLFQLKKYSEAESELREAVRLSPNDMKAHHNLAVVLENQNKSAEARAEYAKAAELKKQESP